MEDPLVVNNAQETRFQAVMGGHLALLDYHVAEGVFRIDYVYVPADFRGQGIAAKLMEAALAFASSEGLRVNAVCSYAQAYLRRRDEQAGMGGQG